MTQTFKMFLPKGRVSNLRQTMEGTELESSQAFDAFRNLREAVVVSRKNTKFSEGAKLVWKLAEDVAGQH